MLCTCVASVCRYKEEVDMVFKRYLPQLEDLFAKFSGKHVLPGEYNVDTTATLCLGTSVRQRLVARAC